MKIIEVIVSKDSQERITGLIHAKHDQIEDSWQYIDERENRFISRILVSEANSQEVLDRFNLFITKAEAGRVLVYPIDASLPQPESAPSPIKTARETLRKNAQKTARIDSVYLALVLLSAIVASIGMVENNIAVVIGAMVIAPLLGPNLSLSVGTALADFSLIIQALFTLLAGLVLSIGFSYFLGTFYTEPFEQVEILSRTEVHTSTIILALASGAAAVLSMTTNVSASLVGVMVAVAILPPACVLGIMLGNQNYSLATGAALLLGINITAVNLAANLVMVIRGISPSQRKQRQKAKSTVYAAIVLWACLLAGLSYLALQVH